MENKMIFLILMIGLVYLLFSANGITALKNLISNATGGTGTPNKANIDPGQQTNTDMAKQGTMKQGTIISGGASVGDNTVMRG